MALLPTLQPIPERNDEFNSHAWQRWLIDLQRKLASTAANILWADVSKTGSTLTDIATRNHADLQNINTASYTHLTATNHTDLTDAGDSALHFHAADRDRANHTGTQAVGTITGLATVATSGAYTDLTGEPTAAIPAQTNVTASRALNTTYTAAAHLMVTATVRCAITLAAGNAYVQGKSDGATPPVTIASGIVGIETGLLGEDNTFQISFVVTSGQTYRLDSAATNGTVVLGAWFETTYGLA